MGLDHLNADHLLADTGQRCTHYPRTGSTETRDSGTGVMNRTDTYSGGTEMDCMQDQPSRKWADRWPEADLTGSIILYLPAASTVAARDKVTFDGLDYRVLDVQKWNGIGVPCLLQRTEGAT